MTYIIHCALILTAVLRVPHRRSGLIIMLGPVLFGGGNEQVDMFAAAVQMVKAADERDTCLWGTKPDSTSKAPRKNLCRPAAQSHLPAVLRHLDWLITGGATCPVQRAWGILCCMYVHEGVRGLISQGTPERVAARYFEGFEGRFELAIAGDAKKGIWSTSPTEFVLKEWILFLKIVR